jgi:short-subunit dehydrogenase
MRAPDNILITGASSGIGAALAREYAAPGRFLALTGRDTGRLESVAADCRAGGAQVETGALDVTDAAAMERWLLALDLRRPLDLVIANAGISAGAGRGTETPDQARAVIATNVDGMLNTLLPLIPPLCERGRGQIAVVSSLAGFVGLPGAAAYCASKAANRVYGEALRPMLRPYGVGVSVICPGFVKSRITADNPFPMPFLMEAPAAARAIRRGLSRDRARIAFPWPLVAGTWLLRTLPAGLVDRLMDRTPRKRAGQGG